jgi:hypothetical protein
MKLFFVLFLVSVFPGVSFAQYSAKNLNVAHLLVNGEVPASRSAQEVPAARLTQEAPAARSTQWEKEQDQVSGHISNSKLLKMKNVTDAIVAFFHDSCLSEGPYSPLWHGEYFSEKNSPGPIMKFGVQCNFYDQKANLTIIANDISPLLNHLVVNNEDFLTIKVPVAIKNDCPYFEYAANGSGSQWSKTWLVSAGDNGLPYTPVTRKEYLQEARTEVTIIKNSILSYIKQTTPIRPAAVQEAEKKAEIDQLNTIYSGIDLQVRIKQLLKNYKTDEEYLKENMEKGTADMDSTLHLMDSLLNHWTVKELNKPAIVSVVAAEFRGFEDGRSDKMLIRMNTAYFAPSSGGEKPQFFLANKARAGQLKPGSDALDREK